MKVLYVLFISILFSACADQKKPLTVAVASNFKTTVESIAEHYQQRYNTEIVVVSASSGQLLAQIRQGAPYDIFLSADTHKLDALLADSIEMGEYAIYAQNLLTLWVNPGHHAQVSYSLDDMSNVNHLVMVNARTALSGMAAVSQ